MPVALRVGDGNDLRVRAQAGQPERGTLRFWLFLRAMCKRRLSRPDRNRCRSPKAEKRNGNTARSPKPTDVTKRSQTEWSGTDGTEQATCSGERPKDVGGLKSPVLPTVPAPDRVRGWAIERVRCSENLSDEDMPSAVYVPILKREAPI